MRHVVCYEGVTQFDRERLEPGSVTWNTEDDRVPVVWQFDFTNASSILGYAKDFQREEDGSVTAEIPKLPESIDQVWEDVGATIYATDITDKKENGIRIVSNCKIRAVSIGLGVPWRLTKKE